MVSQDKDKDNETDMSTEMSDQHSQAEIATSRAFLALKNISFFPNNVGVNISTGG